MERRDCCIAGLAKLTLKENSNQFLFIIDHVNEKRIHQSKIVNRKFLTKLLFSSTKLSCSKCPIHTRLNAGTIYF